MLRYLRLFGIQVRASLLLVLQYRADFMLDAVLSLLGPLTALVPLWVVFEQSDHLAGWSFHESLLVLGWFMLLQGILEGAINPSLTTVVEHIRKGTLDFVLIKPADAQFLVSTAKFLPARGINIVAAIGVFAWSFGEMGRTPSGWGMVQAFILLLTATLLLYSLWILTISLAFYVVRVDNLTYLFTALFDAARWPSSVFRGAWGILFTFVIPLALMTTWPSVAMLGNLGNTALVGGILGALAFSAVARGIWMLSLAKYTSASS